MLIWHQVQDYGLSMLGIIVLLAGLIQLLAGILKLGQWFRAVSPAVIHGMLAGIGILIMSSQFRVMADKKPMGSGIENLFSIPALVVETVSANSASAQALYIGILTIVIIVLWTSFAPRKLNKLPAPLIAAVGAVIVSALLHLKIKYIPDLLDNPDDINKIWTVIQFPSLDNLRRVAEPGILLAAVSVAFIASAETLLGASAVDKLHHGLRTKYDKELTAQGVGNTLCGILGVLPMTGVIVRSKANVDAGARTRTSAILHGVWLLIFSAALPFTLAYIPVSSLAAILVYTGYKLAYPKAVPGLLKFGKSEVVIYLVTIIFIVATNLLEGVLIGLGLSALKLLQAFSHLEIHWDEDFVNNKVNLHLKGAATLIRLPKLAATLEEIRPGAEVHIHFEHLNYIDHACLDLISNWETEHLLTGGSLIIEWEALSSRFHQRRMGAQKKDVRVIT